MTKINIDTQNLSQTLQQVKDLYASLRDEAVNMRNGTTGGSINTPISSISMPSGAYNPHPVNWDSAPKAPQSNIYTGSASNFDIFSATTSRENVRGMSNWNQNQNAPNSLQTLLQTRQQSLYWQSNLGQDRLSNVTKGLSGSSNFLDQQAGQEINKLKESLLNATSEINSLAESMKNMEKGSSEYIKAQDDLVQKTQDLSSTQEKLKTTMTEAEKVVAEIATGGGGGSGGGIFNQIRNFLSENKETIAGVASLGFNVASSYVGGQLTALRPDLFSESRIAQNVATSESALFKREMIQADPTRGENLVRMYGNMLGVEGKYLNQNGFKTADADAQKMLEREYSFQQKELTASQINLGKGLTDTSLMALTGWKFGGTAGAFVGAGMGLSSTVSGYLSQYSNNQSTMREGGLAGTFAGELLLGEDASSIAERNKQQFSTKWEARQKSLANELQDLEMESRQARKMSMGLDLNMETIKASQGWISSIGGYAYGTKGFKLSDLQMGELNDLKTYEEKIKQKGSEIDISVPTDSNKAMKGQFPSLGQTAKVEGMNVPTDSNQAMKGQFPSLGQTTKVEGMNVPTDSNKAMKGQFPEIKQISLKDALVIKETEDKVNKINSNISQISKDAINQTSHRDRTITSLDDSANFGEQIANGIGSVAKTVIHKALALGKNTSTYGYFSSDLFSKGFITKEQFDKINPNKGEDSLDFNSRVAEISIQNFKPTLQSLRTDSAYMQAKANEENVKKHNAEQLQKTQEAQDKITYAHGDSLAKMGLSFTDYANYRNTLTSSIAGGQASGAETTKFIRASRAGLGSMEQIAGNVSSLQGITRTEDLAKWKEIMTESISAGFDKAQTSQRFFGAVTELSQIAKTTSTTAVAEALKHVSSTSQKLMGGEESVASMLQAQRGLAGLEQKTSGTEGLMGVLKASHLGQYGNASETAGLARIGAIGLKSLIGKNEKDIVIGSDEFLAKEGLKLASKRKGVSEESIVAEISEVQMLQFMEQADAVSGGAFKKDLNTLKDLAYKKQYKGQEFKTTLMKLQNSLKDGASLSSEESFAHLSNVLFPTKESKDEYEKAVNKGNANYANPYQQARQKFYNRLQTDSGMSTSQTAGVEEIASYFKLGGAELSYTDKSGSMQKITKDNWKTSDLSQITKGDVMGAQLGVFDLQENKTSYISDISETVKTKFAEAVREGMSSAKNFNAGG